MLRGPQFGFRRFGLPSSFVIRICARAGARRAEMGAPDSQADSRPPTRYASRRMSRPLRRFLGLFFVLLLVCCAAALVLRRKHIASSGAGSTNLDGLVRPEWVDRFMAL